MTPEKIKEKVLQYKWEPWFDRPFGAFLMSLFQGGQTKDYMKKVGVDVEWPATLFQKGAFYKSEEVWDDFEKELQKFIDTGGNVFDVVRCCEEYYSIGKREIDGI